MDDLAYLPPELAAKSLSRLEIVLTLPDTEEAVRILAEQNVAVLEWETWGLYPDGRKGHVGVNRSDYPGRRSDESRAAFVRRTSRACLETARIADAALRALPHCSDIQIHFCLTIDAE